LCAEVPTVSLIRLVIREKPCTATAAGVPLLRLAAQTALLEAEALAEMGGVEGVAARIALAVNADSMSTWFTGAFTELDDVITRRGCYARVW
jgi:LysR family transcriptional regulator (chromosome initiation inhibitor)